MAAPAKNICERLYSLARGSNSGQQVAGRAIKQTGGAEGGGQRLVGQDLDGLAESKQYHYEIHKVLDARGCLVRSREHPGAQDCRGLQDPVFPKICRHEEKLTAFI